MAPSTPIQRAQSYSTPIQRAQAQSFNTPIQRALYGSPNYGPYTGYGGYSYGGYGYGGFNRSYSSLYSSGYYGGGLFGGGLFGGYGYYSPYYEVPVPVVVQPQIVAPPPPVVELSGQLPATLALSFPAPATVWLDGAEVAGAPAETRTLTSRALRPGETYTFHVRARWEADGKTYEATRDVPVGPGSNSRLLVVSGTAVTDAK